MQVQRNLEHLGLCSNSPVLLPLTHNRSCMEGCSILLAQEGSAVWRHFVVFY